MKNKLIGYYSRAADHKFGHAIYTDSSGLKIKITEVIDENKSPLSKWNDLVCVGEVIECIKFNDKQQLSVPEMLEQALNMIQEQKTCQAQFTKTKKCFCFTCPVTYNSN